MPRQQRSDRFQRVAAICARQLERLAPLQFEYSSEKDSPGNRFAIVLDHRTRRRETPASSASALRPFSAHGSRHLQINATLVDFRDRATKQAARSPRQSTALRSSHSGPGEAGRWIGRLHRSRRPRRQIRIPSSTFGSDRICRRRADPHLRHDRPGPQFRQVLLRSPVP